MSVNMQSLPSDEFRMQKILQTIPFDAFLKIIPLSTIVVEAEAHVTHTRTAHTYNISYKDKTRQDWVRSGPQKPVLPPISQLHEICIHCANVYARYD